MGETRSQTITEGALHRLTAVDHNRILNDGTGLSGKVHAGARGVSVHFRYRYRCRGESREMPLGAWPRDTLADIRLQLEETRLRVAHGGDPAGERKLVRDKIKVEHAQVEQQKQEVAARERASAEQSLTVRAMFEAWHPEAWADNTANGVKKLKRMFELHVLPWLGETRVADVQPNDIRRRVKALIGDRKISTATAIHMYLGAMFSWAGKRRPWRLLFDVSPVDDVDIGRLLPLGYQDWSDRVLADDEIVELRNRFQVLRHAFEFRTGVRRGLATPLPREHELATWITLATLVRINEICAARWREHVDFAKATWFIPADQAKNRREHAIHLSAFALKLLRELYELTGHTPFLLPHPADATRPCSTAVIQCAIAARQRFGKWHKKNRTSEVTARSLMLFGGPWSWHDLRRTGATLMQVCGVDEAIVERCLNHSIDTQARRKGLDARLLKTYQHYDYRKEMCRAWDLLGEYIFRLDGMPTQIAGPDEVVVAANEGSMEPPQLDAA